MNSQRLTGNCCTKRGLNELSIVLIMLTLFGLTIAILITVHSCISIKTQKTLNKAIIYLYYYNLLAVYLQLILFYVLNY